jgi:hypothetical protein
MYVFHDGSGNIVGVSATKPATNYVEISDDLAALIKADVTAYRVEGDMVTSVEKAVFKKIADIRYKDLLRANQAFCDLGEYRFSLSQDVGSSLHVACMMIEAGLPGPYTVVCVKGTDIVSVETDVSGIRAILQGLHSAYLNALN